MQRCGSGSAEQVADHRKRKFWVSIFGKATCCRFPSIPLSQGFTGDFLESKNDQMMRCHPGCTAPYLFRAYVGVPPHATALGERPMSWQNPVSCVSDRGRRRSVDRIRRDLVGLPRSSVSDRTCTCRYRIAREEQALLAVSVVLFWSGARFSLTCGGGCLAA